VTSCGGGRMLNMHDPRSYKGVSKMGVSPSGVGGAEVTTCWWWSDAEHARPALQ
jgi:hypothetical protein